MSNYNYLKIDFYGQFHADTIHKLTYPEPYNPNMGTAMMWLNPIKDPRNMRTLFPTAQYGYKLHRDNNGVYYSLLTKYKEDTREGYISITVMVGQQYEGQISGKAIFNLLNMLKTNVLDTNNFTVEAVEQCLRDCQLPAINAMPMRISPVSNIPSSALRTYTTNEELYDIFLFPRQPDYSRFGDIFLINKAWCAAGVPAGVTLLTNPLIRTYKVVKPAGVQCDDSTQTGKSLMITYTKPGFAPLTIPVSINGVGNQYVQYEGSRITVKVPADLPFKQRVNVVVRVNGKLYNDSKVTASLGNETLQYNSQQGAYSAEVSQAALAGGDVRFTINVNDPTLVNKNSAMAANAYQQPSRRRYDDYDDDDEESTTKKWMMPLLAFLLGALIFGAVAYFLMRGGDDENSGDNKVPTEQVDNNPDLEYLKKNDIWTINNIQSDKYKELFNSIKNGNVNTFMNLAGEYINLPTDKCNGLVKKIYDIINDSDLQDQASSVFQGGSKGGNVDLRAILNQLTSLANGSGNSGGDDYSAPAPAVQSPAPNRPAANTVKPATPTNAKPTTPTAKPTTPTARPTTPTAKPTTPTAKPTTPTAKPAATPKAGGPNAGSKKANQER